MIKSTFAKIFPLLRFGGSRTYWESRYRLGGNSGSGSYGENAAYKAKVINHFVRENSIRSAIEFGCGDGNQLDMFNLQNYTGVDVSQAAILRCQRRFSGDESKRFVLLDDVSDEHAEMALSIDVIFHLVEDQVYETHLHNLFNAATRRILIYSTDVDMPDTGIKHVRHRNVSRDIEMMFPSLERMEEFEASIEDPVKFDRGHPTKFIAYRKP